ncbi:MAG: protein kinase [Deltaproteobacteria bacterium]|nr:protein kinase [Deltaproteobacteria bacterium]
MTEDKNNLDTLELSLVEEVDAVPSGDDASGSPKKVPKFSSVRQVAKTLGVNQKKNASKMFDAGDVIDGRYKVDRCLGVGAMGSVFLVNHTRLNKPFALKMIIPELAQRKDFVARFEREAAACSKLNHPNCISVTDFGHTDDGSLYLVMEYVDGIPLSDVVREGPVPLEDAMEYTLQVLSGLEHAHSKGIVHRDIKLENVMRCHLDNGDALMKILDFGMARAQVRANESPAITKRGVVMGTPQYMAPEQLRNKPADERSDLYSVGVLFFRLLTGKPLFRGESMIDILAAKLNQPAPTLSEVTTFEYPEVLETFFEKVLQRNPERRFASAREMMDALLEVRDEIRGRSTREFRAQGMKASAATEKAISSSPPRPRGTITIGDLFDRPFEDLAYWYTCGRNPARASWRNRIKALFKDRVGKLVMIRFVFLLMLLAIGGVAAVLIGMEYAIWPMTPSVPEAVSDRQDAGTADETSIVRSPETVDGPAINAAPVKRNPAQQVAKRESAADAPSTPAVVSDADADESAVGSDTDNQTAAAVQTEGPPAPLSGAQPAPLDNTLRAIEQDIQRDMCSKSVKQLSAYLQTPDANGGGGNYLLGRASMCLGKHKDALKFYQHAVAIDSGYRNDRALTEDVHQIVLSGKATDEGLVFMKDVMGEAALPMLTKFAGHAQRKSFRQKARDIVAEMGALDQVNLEASYDWDLNQAGSCKEKAEVVIKLKALNTQRAKLILMRARDMKEREGLFREKYIHACVRQQIIDAINTMDAVKE